MEKKNDDLEKRISLIEERNKRVENDKAWETSWLRKILIVVLTYIFAVLYLTIANTTNPFFGAVVPCAGFFLSTLTLKLIKDKWISDNKKGGKNSGKTTRIVIGIILAIVIVTIVSIISVSVINGIREEEQYNARYDEISYDVPSDFEGDDHYYSYYDDFIACNFDVNGYEKEIYESTKDLLTEQVYLRLDDEISDIKEEVINDIPMSYVKLENGSFVKYYYAFESSNYIYLFNYDINDDLHGDRSDAKENICYTAKDEILSTIKVS